MEKLSNVFWDCECEHYYIHTILHDKCSVCGALQIDQPPSRQAEIREGLELAQNRPTPRAVDSAKGEKIL